VPLCRAGGVVAGQGSLERICPDFGRRKKGGVWSKYLQGMTLTDAKKLAGESLPSNGLAFPQITRSAGIFWLSKLTSKLEVLHQ
jgi:hypothetical protein